MKQKTGLRTIIIISSLLLAAVLASCGKASSADTAKESALQAYQKILKDAPAIEGEHDELADAAFGYEQNQEMFGKHYDYFALYDLNQDDIPELIALSVVNFRWTSVSIYTYADGEAVLLKNPNEMSSNVTFEQNSTANGAYITYICEENHIHSLWGGTNPMGEAAEENHAYAVEEVAIKEVECTASDSENIIYFDDIAQANTAENVYKIGKN